MSIEFCCIIYIIFTEVEGKKNTKIIENGTEKSEYESGHENDHFGMAKLLILAQKRAKNARN